MTRNGTSSRRRRFGGRNRRQGLSSGGCGRISRRSASGRMSGGGGFSGIFSDRCDGTALQLPTQCISENAPITVGPHQHHHVPTSVSTSAYGSDTFSFTGSATDHATLTSWFGPFNRCIAFGQLRRHGNRSHGFPYTLKLLTLLLLGNHFSFFWIEANAQRYSEIDNVTLWICSQRDIAIAAQVIIGRALIEMKHGCHLNKLT